ncbi:MAG: hypothetical protein QGG53_21730 [Planctomycetota bacterium]|jgi:hypothetical protein|nr:hypothetical protein [Planctomycetota bacterium]
MKKKKASNEFKETTNEEEEYVPKNFRLPFFCLKKKKALHRNRVMSK